MITINSNTKSFDSSSGTYGPNYHGKVTSYQIAPNYSYFIADKLDLGVSVGYSSSDQKADNQNIISNTYKEHGYNASVYLRKYFLYDNKVGVRTGPYFDYQNSKRTQSYDSFNDNVNKSNIYIPVVLAWNLFISR